MIKWDLAGLIPQLTRQEESRKSALPALIERIKAYPDRKMEVRFRIGGKFEGTHGGQDLYPHESQYPVHELSFARVSIMGLRAQVFLMIPDIGYFNSTYQVIL